jgi:putative membrane protein
MMTRGRSLGVLLVLLGGTSVAGAQPTTFGNPAGLAPDTARVDQGGKAAPDHANDADALFVREMALGGKGEVALGELAAKKAGNPAVRDFAQAMVDAHGKSNDALTRAGRGVNDLPDQLAPEHEATKSALGKRSGRDFDAYYVAAQIRDHQRTANLLLWEISSGQNAALVKYASATLPEVLHHLEMAQALANEMAAPPASRSAAR